MARGWTCPRCASENDERAVSCTTCGLIRGGVVTAPNPTAAPPPTPPAAPGPEAGPDTQPPGWTASPGPPEPAAWAAGAGSGGDAPAAPGGAMTPDGWSAPTPPAPSAPGQAATGFLAKAGIRIVLIAVVALIVAVVGWYNAAGRDTSGQINKTGELSASDLKVGDCFDLPGDAATFDPNATVDKTTAMACTQTHHYEVFFTGQMPDPGQYPTQDQFSSFVDANCGPAFQGYVGTPPDQTSLTIYWFYPQSNAWSSGDHSIQCSLADPNLKPLSKSMKGSGY